MENNQSANRENEEIDLGDLFLAIKKGFTSIGLLFLRFFALLIRNALLLIILIVIGVVVGYFIDTTHPKKYETQLLVNSSFESGEYLYKSVQGIEFKLKSADTAFLKKTGITAKQAKDMEIDIAPVFSMRNLSESQLAYMDFIIENDLGDEENKSAIFKRDFTAQKITLIHPLNVDSQSILKNILASIRNNTYYKEVNQDYLTSIKEQLKSNETLISQIDTLIKNYSNNLVKNNTVGMGSTYYSEDNSLDVAQVLQTRIGLQKQKSDLLRKKVDHSEFLRIIDLSSSSEAERNILSRKMVLLPLLLILAFFFFVILRIIYYRTKSFNMPVQE